MKLSHRAKQLIAMVFLSSVASVVMIAHGVLFELNFGQVYRLTLQGFLVTMPSVFLFMIVLEWVFDLKNEKD